MRALAKSMRQSCHLAVRHNADMTVLAQVESPEDKGFTVRLGMHAPLLDTTSGLVLLAFENPMIVEDLLTELEAGGTPRTAVVERLRKIRRDGYVQTESRTIEGIVDLVAPILDHERRGIAALTVPFVRLRGQKPDWEALRQELLAATAEISSSVGGGTASLE